MKTLKAFLVLVFMVPTILLAQASGEKSAPAPTANPGQALAEVKTYDQLRRAISKTRAEGRVRVEKAVERERVREAWEIGKLIDAHVLQHKERADYAEHVLQRLAQDLGMSQSELYRMLEFYRAYPIFARVRKLSWSHYEALLAVNVPETRNALAEQAEKENWSRDRLREEVKAVTQKEKPAEEKASEALTPLAPGQPGTYKIVLAQTGPYKDQLVLDLGFSTYFLLAEVAEDLSPFHEGDLVSFVEKEIQLLGKPRNANIESLLYTYKVWVDRVLDGDTIKVTVDLGFGITLHQTLRLRGIDAPELPTKAGEEAKAFVEECLPPGTLLFIKTSKSDKYDRYLADVFITDKSGEEQYLNNLLLEKGYAVRVKG